MSWRLKYGYSTAGTQPPKNYRKILMKKNFMSFFNHNNNNNKYYFNSILYWPQITLFV